MPYRRLSVLAVALVVSGTGCTETGARPRRDSGVGVGGGGDAPSDPVISGCDASRDADGDGVADQAEGSTDADGDGTGNDHDLDSDGDGIGDTEEHQGRSPCTRPDTDGDGTPNWVDTDSDNDGLPDVEERGTFSTDPYERDTDSDGVTDLGEARGTMTDPRDAASTIPPEDFFVVLPYNGAHENRTLRFGTTIHQADVYFLIDTTGSMGSPIANVQSSLTRISTELSARIEDVQMGVGHFEDFPNEPDCGFFDFDCISGSAYGAAGDVAYANLQDITDSVSAVQTALNGLELGNGADGPESQIEAIYQTATGEGGSWTFDSGASHSIPPRTCPTIPDEVGTRRGYPCFRPGALPIIVLVSDVTFHNGPASGNGYAGIAPPPHGSAHASDAVAALGARVVGVAIGGGGRNDQEALARASGTVDGTGRPLVYDSAGGEVSDAIIEGITTLVGGTPQDVTTATENVAGNPGGVDAREFIVSITPVEGFRDGIAGTGYASKDTTTFYEVVPGTLVDFAVDFHNDFVPPAETAVIFRAVIVVMGNGVARLDERQVYIIVPPEGAVILI